MKPTEWIDHGLGAVSRRMDQGRHLVQATRHRMDQGKRVTYAAGGTGMMLAGLRRRSVPGIAMALVGCDLVCRGVTGDSLWHLQRFRPWTNGSRRPGYGYGVKVQESAVIHKPPEVLYRFLRNPRNVLGLIDRIDSIETDGEYSRWRVRDHTGRIREWYGEIIADRENELIGWRTVEGGAIDHAGSIRFEPSGPRRKGAHAFGWGRRSESGASATRLTVSLQYNPRFGTAADSVARLFGADPATWIRHEFERFRDFAESNDLKTIEGLLQFARAT